MKTHSHHRPVGAFTLIELLVVITIIAILASVSVPMGKMVMDKARRASASNDCQQLTNAITSYYTEYNRYPVTTDNEGPYETERNLMDVLMANPDNGEARMLNPREIRFYEAGKVVKDPNTQGFVEGLGQLNDPWGKKYEVYMDADDDGRLQVPAIYGNKYGTGGTVMKRTLVHSSGSDRRFSTADDNVTSWD